MAKLPTIVSNIPRDLRLFLERVREAFDANGDDQLLTRRSLRDAGLINVVNGQIIPAAAEGSYVTPPAPTNLAAAGALATIILDWDTPNYLGHAYTEIWAAQEPVGGGTPALGDAVLIGQTPGAVFSHNIGSAATRWYWIRFVNIADEAGPYNAVEGVQASTGQDPAYLLDLLAGQITESQLYQDLGDRIDLIDGPSTLPGSVAEQILAEQTARTQAVQAESAARSAAIQAESAARVQAVLDESNARQAAIQSEVTAREASDLSLASATQTLATQLRGNYAGSDIAQIQTGLIHSERQSRITADTNLQQQINTIVAASSGDFGELFTAVQEEATARIAADEAISSTVDLLTSRLDNVKDAAGNPTNKTVEATLVDDRSARVSADSALASDITSLETTIGGVSANLSTNYYTTVQTDSAISVAQTSLRSEIQGTQSALLPSNFQTGFFNWTESRIGNPATVASVTGRCQFVSNDANFGACVEFTTGEAGNNILTRGVIPGGDRVYRIRVRFKLLSAPAATHNYTFIIQGLDASYGSTFRSFPGSTTVAVGSTIHEMTLTFAASAGTGVDLAVPSIATSAYIRAGFRNNLTGPAVARVGSITIEDVTDAVAISANLESNYLTETETNSAIAAASLSLQSQINGVSSNLANNYFTSAQTNSAITTASTTLQSSINGVSTAIQTEATTRATADNALKAQYTVKVDTNGYVSGFGLASTTINATPTSEFIVRSDKFAIANPAGPGIAPSEPFLVRTTAGTVNGVSVSAGVYMRDAFIQNGTITNAKIGNLAVNAAKIADATITTAKIGNAQITGAKIADATITAAKIGNAQITTAKIGNAQITNAKIGNLAVNAAKIADGSITNAKIGNLAVNNAKIADGSITNAKIGNLAVNNAKIADGAISRAKIGDLAVDTAKIANTLQSTNYSASSAGWRINKAGDAEFNDITVRGDLVNINEKYLLGISGDWYRFQDIGTNLSITRILNQIGGAGTYAFVLVGGGGSGGVTNIDTTRSAASGGGAAGLCNFVYTWNGTTGLTVDIGAGGAARLKVGASRAPGNAGTRSRFLIAGTARATANGGGAGNAQNSNTANGGAGGTASFSAASTYFPIYSRAVNGGRGGNITNVRQTASGGGGIDAFDYAVESTNAGDITAIQSASGGGGVWGVGRMTVNANRMYGATIYKGASTANFQTDTLGGGFLSAFGVEDLIGGFGIYRSSDVEPRGGDGGAFCGGGGHGNVATSNDRDNAKGGDGGIGGGGGGACAEAGATSGAGGNGALFISRIS